MSPYGLSVRKFGLLVQLQIEPELTMSELARQLGVSRQSLHELVGELERAGHLRRLPGATGRTRRLVLSPGARRLVAHTEGPLMRMEADFLGDMDPSEVETLRTLLQRLLAHATDDETWLAGT
ncbi:MarR family winged helix-turn-helix transcriptional regulator [Streptosporangium lutulentum]